eukprot:CAMPEP_0178993826 /NCGR_PEP_ID=MMETSP0795-20121207/6926_1 /TAXON_ID=88552 /ORGANISM="Amoebophrya sp., Strain Ameob2" /LENGTH=804 /DNA_ID=CAMNT_0020685943 /DNA_START=84 /DNA_END=2503 /DNA_ORIENTATION=-
MQTCCGCGGTRNGSTATTPRAGGAGGGGGAPAFASNSGVPSAPSARATRSSLDPVQQIYYVTDELDLTSVASNNFSQICDDEVLESRGGAASATDSVLMRPVTQITTARTVGSGIHINEISSPALTRAATSPGLATNAGAGAVSGPDEVDVVFHHATPVSGRARPKSVSKKNTLVSACEKNDLLFTQRMGSMKTRSGAGKRGVGTSTSSSSISCASPVAFSPSKSGTISPAAQSTVLSERPQQTRIVSQLPAHRPASRRTTSFQLSSASSRRILPLCENDVGETVSLTPPPSPFGGASASIFRGRRLSSSSSNAGTRTHLADEKHAQADTPCRLTAGRRWKRRLFRGVGFRLMKKIHRKIVPALYVNLFAASAAQKSSAVDEGKSRDSAESAFGDIPLPRHGNHSSTSRNSTTSQREFFGAGKNDHAHLTSPTTTTTLPVADRVSLESTASLMLASSVSEEGGREAEGSFEGALVLSPAARMSLKSTSSKSNAPVATPASASSAMNMSRLSHHRVSNVSSKNRPLRFRHVTRFSRANWNCSSTLLEISPSEGAVPGAPYQKRSRKSAPASSLCAFKERRPALLDDAVNQGGHDHHDHDHDEGTLPETSSLRMLIANDDHTEDERRELAPVEANPSCQPKKYASTQRAPAGSDPDEKLVALAYAVDHGAGTPGTTTIPPRRERGGRPPPPRPKTASAKPADDMVLGASSDIPSSTSTSSRSEKDSSTATTSSKRARRNAVDHAACDTHAAQVLHELLQTRIRKALAQAKATAMTAPAGADEREGWRSAYSERDLLLGVETLQDTT